VPFLTWAGQHFSCIVVLDKGLTTATAFVVKTPYPVKESVHGLIVFAVLRARQVDQADGFGYDRGKRELETLVTGFEAVILV
jgi:hypothetical protein